MIEHSAIPMSSPNFCLEVRDNVSKDEIIAILNKQKKKGREMRNVNAV